MTGTAVGTVKVRAAVGDRNLDFDIEVKNAVFVELDKESASLKMGNSLKLSASVNGGVGGETITWTSSDTSIATVDTEGNVTPVAVGTATITASSEGAEDATDVLIAMGSVNETIKEVVAA